MKCLIPYFAGKLPLYLSENCRPSLSHNQHFSEQRMLTVYIHGAMLVPAGSKEKSFLYCWFTWQPCHHIQGKPVPWVKFTSCWAPVGLPLVFSLLINKLKTNYITKTKYKLGNINIHTAVNAHSLSWTALIWWSFQFMESMACVLPKIPEAAFSENVGHAK